MRIDQVIEIAVAHAEKVRVEVMALEPAEISEEAVAGLAELVFELVDNAIQFSAPEDKVQVAGLFAGDAYLISISDRGVGISEVMVEVINKMLDDPAAIGRNPDAALGLRFVARLAARHSLVVHLVPGAVGTTARVTVPSALARRVGVPVVESAWTEEPVVESAWTEEPVVALAGPETEDAEAFLERVFASLERETEEPDPEAVAIPLGWGTATVSALRVRVPGQAFSVDEEDSPSTTAAEGAVDLRSALSTYAEGRRSAEAAGA